MNTRYPSLFLSVSPLSFSLLPSLKFDHLSHRNTTTRHTPSTEDVRETSLDQVTPLMTETPPLPPPPKRPSVARAVSIASNYDAQINEEEEGKACCHSPLKLSSRTR